jgi:phosphinothricin acetyltransferase
MNSPGIRLADLGDAGSLLDIYAPYILNTDFSFEYIVPSLEDFTLRLEEIMSVLPCLVYEEDGETRGYAYAAKFRSRAAYRWDVELSIYLSESIHGRGTGSRLLSALLELLRALGYLTVYACITLPNPKSVSLCEKSGFSSVGVMHGSGFKRGQWHDVLWLEKRLAPLPSNPVPPRSIHEIAPQIPAIIAGAVQA